MLLLARQLEGLPAQQLINTFLITTSASLVVILFQSKAIPYNNSLKPTPLRSAA